MARTAPISIPGQQPNKLTTVKWLASKYSDKSRLENELALLLRGELPTGWQWVGSSPFAKVARSGDAKPLFFKQFLDRNAWEGIKACLRGSRSQRAVKNSQRLIEKRFNAPSTLCYSKRFTLTEGIVSDGFGDLLTDFSEQSQAQEKKYQLIEQVGFEVGRLHQAGISHGDLRPNNLLLEQSTQKIYFIDNERTEFFPQLPYKLRVKNLVQIGMQPFSIASKLDRLRFFNAYMKSQKNLARDEQIRLMDDVQRTTQWRMDKKKQRS